MKTLTQTTDGITEGQSKLLTRMISDVADCNPVREALAGLSKKAAERLKGNPQFAADLRQLVVEKIAEYSSVDEFTDEEIESSYGYLSGYAKPDSLHDQTNLLRKLFPCLSVASPSFLMKAEEKKIPLPPNAEGWFAIPNWKKNPKIFGPTYSSAVQKVLDTIEKAREGNFHNYRKGQVDEKHLRQSAASVEAWDKLAEEQGNPDILIIPAQFGIRHRGRSVRRARVIMDDSNGEVGLGAFAGCIMVLTHPVRLQHLDDLWIDFAGDEFSPDADGRFSGAPRLSFGDGGVEFDAKYVSVTCDHYGSASWFPPQ